MHISFEEYVDGVRSNSRIAIDEHPQHFALFTAIERSFERVLQALGNGSEGSAIFAAMSHAAFLSSVQLASSGQLPPAFMVARGCVENAIYGFFLFQNPELKEVWMAREDSGEAKKRVRTEFTIGRMKRCLTAHDLRLGEQFDLIYDATIDHGAHPNALAFISHLMPLDDSGDQLWQYLNTSSVDQRFALRVVAMAGLNALNIFAAVFPNQFTTTGALHLLHEAHTMYSKLPGDLSVA